jgi:hypothetical protein
MPHGDANPDLSKVAIGASSCPYLIEQHDCVDSISPSRQECLPHRGEKCGLLSVRQQMSASFRLESTLRAPLTPANWDLFKLTLSSRLPRLAEFAGCRAVVPSFALLGGAGSPTSRPTRTAGTA